APGLRCAGATLSPLPRGEGSAPSARPRYRSSTDEYARLRCVSCFTLDSANAFYRDAVTERSVMAVGGRLPPPLLGVSSLDLAPLAFSRRGLFHRVWFAIAGGCSLQKKRAGRSRRDPACGDYAPSVPQAGGVGNLFPMGQAFRDDLGRLQRGLAQGRVLDDLALHARGLALQRITQRLQLGDELVDFLHRRPCYPLQELV